MAGTGRRSRLARAAGAALAVAVVTALTGACDTEAQFAPSLPVAAGFRVDGGVLKLWTGTPCEGVIGLRLIATSGTQDSTQEWSAPRPGVRLERLDLLPPVAASPADPAAGTPAAGTPAAGTPGDGTPGDGTPGDGTPGDGLTVDKPLPAGYDWTTADSIHLAVNGPPSFGTRVDVARVLRESPRHPAGSYLFGDRGWMDASDVRRENRTSFLTVCTPDPKK